MTLKTGSARGGWGHTIRVDAGRQGIGAQGGRDLENFSVLEAAPAKEKKWADSDVRTTKKREKKRKGIAPSEVEEGYLTPRLEDVGRATHPEEREKETKPSLT